MEGAGEKPKESVAGGGTWSEDAVRVLIESYTAKFVELQRSNLRQKDWQDVLARLSSTCGEGYNYARCRNKLDSLKKKFKNVKNKRNTSGGSKAGVKWKWYDQMEKLMERSGTGNSSSRCVQGGIPGGIASGEKLGPSLDDNSDCDEEGESSAASQDDEEETTDRPHHPQPQQQQESEENEMMNAQNSSGFLFDLRQNGGLAMGNGLNLALSGLCSQVGALSSGLRAPPTLPRIADRPIKKREKSSSSSSYRQMKEVVAMVIEAMERIEKNRLEFEHKKMEMIREMDLKRNETNLQIARFIVENCMPRNFSGE